MRIVLGVDLRPHSIGALRFTRWLVDARVAEDADVLGVHAIEMQHLLRAVPPFGPGTLPQRLLPELRTSLDDAGLPGARAEIVEAEDAEQALVDACARHSAELLVLGRRGFVSSFVRLGRTSRRLLRSLPCPVAVAPRDLDATAIGPGPIVLATDLGPTSSGAARFAESLALAAGAPLLVVHVVPTETEPHTAYVRAGIEFEGGIERLVEQRQRELTAWMHHYGLAEAQSAILQGDLVQSLVEVCEQRGAPALIMGSRRLELARRFFVASAVSTTSGLATRTVITVPPVES